MERSRDNDKNIKTYAVYFRAFFCAAGTEQIVFKSSLYAKIATISTRRFSAHPTEQKFYDFL